MAIPIKKLKLYVNRKFVIPAIPYIPILFPFWGPILNSKTHYDEKNQEYGFDVSYFDLTSSIKDAEYVLMPHDYWKLKRNRPDLLQKIIQEAEAHKKPLLIDASGDAAGRVDVPNSRVLRVNQYRFKIPAHEITVPVPCEDLLESHCDNKLILREKKEIPIIGFVGWGKLSLRQRIRTSIKEFPLHILTFINNKYKVYHKGVFWREYAIKVFSNSKFVKTNFIIRSSYSGHITTSSGNPEKNRIEFIENMIESDYILIVKGDANIATRFYEALSMGRIPIFIDTACVLPLENIINYREFCVFIDYTDINRAPDILVNFHKNISSGQFIAMQKKARYTFENYLRYDKFSKYLVAILRSTQNQLH